jgi:hypothetical protein
MVAGERNLRTEPEEVMKTYELRSSAVRAAKNAGLKDEQFEVVKVWQKGGKSCWQYVAKGEATEEKGAVPVEVTEVPTPAVEVPPTVEPTTSAAPVATVERVRESTIEKPTKAVWTIADEMKAANPTVTRKAIVDECVRRGVAFYTARTQYQRWAKSKATPAA